MAEEITTTNPPVVSQKDAMIGDEHMEPRKPGIHVNDAPVDAQVSPPREDAADMVVVHETMITVDEVITDPSSPLAVQIPDAGRGTLDLPMHRLSRGTVEDQLREMGADKASRKTRNS